MKTRNLPRFSTAVFLWTPACALALGVGQLELRSGLNQALNGTIPLRSASEEELANLSVSLASPQAFARLGLERAAFLSDIEFSVETDMAGNPYVRVPRAGRSASRCSIF